MELSNNEMCFKVERSTTLRVWKHDKIYMRLDKYKQYSVPFTQKTVNYLNNVPHQLRLLLEMGEFTFDLSFESAIVGVLETMVITKRKDW